MAKNWRFILLLIICATFLVVIVGLVIGLVSILDKQENIEQVPDKDGQSKASISTKSYRFAGVSSASPVCSQIATEVLGAGGSATDAAIACAICIGVVRFSNSGIGGGLIMTVSESPQGSTKPEIKSILSREVAPGAATQDMYVNTSDASTFGGLAVGVPGEVQGFYKAWQMYGKLPWRNLWQPSICLLKNGFIIEKHIEKAINIGSVKKSILKSESLKEILFVNGRFLKQGDRVKRPKLAVTYERIADDPFTFYNGSMANDIVADIADGGGIITKEDLENYSTWVTDPVMVNLSSIGFTANSPPPPSSGTIVTLLLKIIDRLKLSPEDISTPDRKARTFHLLMEAYKFAYAKRSALGDSKVNNQMKEIVSNWTSDGFIDYIMSRMNHTQTQEISYYEPHFENPADSGTSHISIIAPGGGAVSLTSTTNFYFGSKLVGNRTGIIFNNQMDDFSTPGTINSYGYPASPSNFISPGKMPMSSTSPTIITDSQGIPVYVSGGTGGSRIITGLVEMALRVLWLGQSLEEAANSPRLHHQLVPNAIRHEAEFDKEILSLLEEYGHKTLSYDPGYVISTVNTVRRYCGEPCKSCLSDCPTKMCIHANSDHRSGGRVDGF